MVGSEYRFDPKKLSEAHNDCLLRYLRAIDDGYSIVVDNTNIGAFEYAPYYRVAEAMGLPVTLVTVRCDPVVAHARNVHGVPLATVQAMAARLEAEFVPPWWNHEVINVS